MFIFFLSMAMYAFLGGILFAYVILKEVVKTWGKTRWYACAGIACASIFSPFMFLLAFKFAQWAQTYG